MKIEFNLEEFKNNCILPKYKEDFQDYSHRYNVFWGGAGSGKSNYVVSKIIVKCLLSKRRVLVTRKIDRSIKNSIFAEFKSRIASMGMNKIINVNKTDMTITFSNGSEIIFKGLQDVETLKSIANITDIVIEEATEINKGDFNQLNTRLRGKGKNKQIYLMFNPTSKFNWTYKFWGLDTGIAPEDTFIIHSTYKDNTFLDKEYLKMLDSYKEKDYTHYKIYALGEFISLDKKVFENWKVKEFDVMEVVRKKINIDSISNFNMLKGNPLYRKRLNSINFRYGVDTGWNDPTSISCIMVDETEKEIYIYDEFYERFIDNDMLVKAMNDLGIQKETIIMDSADAKGIQHLRKKGLKIVGAKKGRDSIMNGIKKLKEYNIFISPHCINAIMEFENYSWTKDKYTDQYIDKPIDTFNHFIDCLRYAMERDNTGNLSGLRL